MRVLDLSRLTSLSQVARSESTTTRPAPSTTAAIGTGSLVLRSAVIAASITADHDATEVAKGAVARFQGSSGQDEG